MFSIIEGEVRLKDKNGREAQIDPSGYLKVTTPPPEPPTGTTSVNRTEYNSASTSGSQNTYIIPNGETLTIQRFLAGAGAASKAILYYAPNGSLDGSEELIVVCYLNDSNYVADLETKYSGDGTAAIIMERVATGWSGAEVFARWTGYY